MRVIGGRLKGRVLKGPASPTRPTSDRLRESLFNILMHAYDAIEGARVVDLFAGTGALGVEALSRGARFALFVDEDAAAAAVIRGNIEALRLSGMARFLRRDARRLGPAPEGERYRLAFVDPPYGRGLALPALRSLRDGGWLEQDALIVIEEGAETEIALPEGFTHIETRRSGDTQILFARAP